MHTVSDQCPNRQQAYDLALQMGFDVLLSRPPADAVLHALGAERRPNAILVPALGQSLLVDMDARSVFVDDGGRAARSVWAVLVVHYLAATDVSRDDKYLQFAHFADCRSYLNVFNKRIVERFLATTGRTEEIFVEAAEKLAAERLPGPGVRFSFNVLPRLPVILVRYDDDPEMGAGASIIYQADVERILPAEDRVVSAELLLDSLAGKVLEDPCGGPR